MSQADDATLLTVLAMLCRLGLRMRADLRLLATAAAATPWARVEVRRRVQPVPHVG